MKKEYYTTSELAKLKCTTTTKVRKIINKISTTKDLLYQKNGIYYIHHLLLPKFDVLNEKENKEFAYTLDIPVTYSDNDVKTILKYIVNEIDLPTTIQYVTEKKKANNMNHLHAIVTTKSKKKFLTKMYDYFYNCHYHTSPIFDRNGWINYITKENKNIITITNNN